jgi:hypothetical protein
MQALLEVMRAAGCTQHRPISQPEIYAAGRKAMATGHQIADALADLCGARLISTAATTVDGVTQIQYWPAGSSSPTPMTSPAITKDQKMQNDSKSAMLRRLISEHGPITTTNLLGLANAEGGNIAGKSVASLLAGAVKSGTIVKIGEGSKIQWATPDQAGARATVEAGVMPVSSTSEIAKEPPDPARLLRKIADLEAELSTAQANEKTESDRATALATDLAEICRALDVPHAGDAVAAIEHLEKLADAKNAQDFGDLGRYRALLEQIASHFHCGSIDDLPEVVASLGTAKQFGTEIPVNETRQDAPGRLALLVMGENETELHWLEPYVTDGEGEGLAINQVHCGAAQRALLIRALYSATRKIEHGPIAVPAVDTLHG